MNTKTRKHNLAIEWVARSFIENGISTRNGKVRGEDLVLDDGKTVRVRGLRDEVPVVLMNGSTDSIKTDYVVIITNLGYTIKKIHIMSTDQAKEIASYDTICKRDQCNEAIISIDAYQKYRDNYGIF